MVPGSRQRRFDHYHDPRYTRHPLIASPLLLFHAGSSDQSLARTRPVCRADPWRSRSRLPTKNPLRVADDVLVAGPATPVLEKVGGGPTGGRIVVRSSGLADLFCEPGRGDETRAAARVLRRRD
jgi:hypothetical protein